MCCVIWKYENKEEERKEFVDFSEFGGIILMKTKNVEP